jgi:hypothetical protein
MSALRCVKALTELLSCRKLPNSLARTVCSTGLSHSENVFEDTRAKTWKERIERGEEVNPCGSQHHPVVKAGLLEAAEEQHSLQEAYSPWSRCFGCGGFYGGSTIVALRYNRWYFSSGVYFNNFHTRCLDRFSAEVAPKLGRVC